MFAPIKSISSPTFIVCGLAAVISSTAWSERTSHDDSTLVLSVQQRGEDAVAPLSTATKIHPSGRLLVTAGDDHVVRFWNLATGQLIRELPGHQDWIDAIAFSPNGRIVATAGTDRTVLFWDILTGKPIKRLRVPQAVSSLSYNHNGSLVAVAGFQKELWLYNAKSFQLVQTLTGPCQDIRCVVFSHDDRFVATGGRNGRLRIFDLNSAQERTIQAHHRRIRAIAFSTDNQFLVTGGEDRLIKAWDASSFEPVASMPCTSKIMSMVAVGSHRIATGGSDNCISIWDLKQQKRLTRLNGHQGSVVSLDFHRGTLVSGAYDNTIRVWNTSDTIGRLTRN